MAKVRSFLRTNLSTDTTSQCGVWREELVLSPDCVAGHKHSISVRRVEGRTSAVTAAGGVGVIITAHEWHLRTGRAQGSLWNLYMDVGI